MGMLFSLKMGIDELGDMMDLARPRLFVMFLNITASKQNLFIDMSESSANLSTESPKPVPAKSWFAQFMEFGEASIRSGKDPVTNFYSESENMIVTNQLYRTPRPLQKEKRDN